MKRLEFESKRVVEIKGKDYCASEIVIRDNATKEQYFITFLFDEGDKCESAIYKSSYIDFVLSGGIKPIEIKWDVQLFTDYTGESSIEKQKQKLMNLVSDDCMRLIIKKNAEKYLAKKTVEIQKPHGNIEYTVVSKKKIEGNFSSKYVMDTIWEVEFYLPKTSKTIYAMSNDSYGDTYAIAVQSRVECAKADKDISSLAIEEYDTFEKTVDSYYYDLFYELEKYKDETLKEDLKNFLKIDGN